MEKDMNNMGINQSSTSTSVDKKSSVSDKVGDALEGIGHKVSEMGLPKVGQKIHDLGDKLEENHSDPSHPHDV